MLVKNSSQGQTKENDQPISNRSLQIDKRSLPNSRGQYLFDVSKADQIFDYLLKDKKIKLPFDHKILPIEERKNKKYYKWYNSWTHNTNFCITFSNTIQCAISNGRFEFPEEKRPTQQVDSNPFSEAPSDEHGELRLGTTVRDTG